MKSFFLTTLIVFSGSALFSQIPNSDFENWTDQILWEELDGWISNYGDFGAVSIWKDSDACSNTFATHLANFATPSFMFSNFNIASHPHNLTACVKGSIAQNDSVWMKVTLFANGIAVDSGKWVGYNSISNYTQALVNITSVSSVADSAEIYISGGYDYNTYLLVDHLQFDDVTEGISNPGNVLQIKPLQNPFDKNLSLFLNLSSDAMLHIVNNLGQEVISTQIFPDMNQINLDTSFLPAGIYFCMLEKGNAIQSLKVLKQ